MCPDWQTATVHSCTSFCTGKDEFGILLTSDYKDIVWRAADEAAAAAAATAAAVTAAAAATAAGAGAGAGASNSNNAHGGAGVSTPASSGRAAAADRGRAYQSQGPNGADPAARVLSYGAYGSAEDYEHPSNHQGHAYGNGGSGSGAGGFASGGAGGGGGGRVPGSGRASKWHAAAEAFLERVVDRYYDFELSSDHLMRLLLSGPGPGAAAASVASALSQAGAGSAAARQAAAAAADAAGPSTAAEMEDVVSRPVIVFVPSCNCCAHENTCRLPLRATNTRVCLRAHPAYGTPLACAAGEPVAAPGLPGSAHGRRRRRLRAGSAGRGQGGQGGWWPRMEGMRLGPGQRRPFGMGMYKTARDRNDAWVTMFEEIAPKGNYRIA